MEKPTETTLSWRAVWLLQQIADNGGDIPVTSARRRQDVDDRRMRSIAKELKAAGLVDVAELKYTIRDEGIEWLRQNRCAIADAEVEGAREMRVPSSVFDLARS